MGGIVIKVKTDDGVVKWGGHALTVSEWFNLKDLQEVEEGDSHNGFIIFDLERRTVSVDTEYFAVTSEVAKFWQALGFDVLARVHQVGEIN